MKFELDTHYVIPICSDLRTLLNSEHISYGEIHTLLKSKGIFVGNTDKVITVPLLSATLLTPTEFSNLIEHSIDRDLKPKTKVSDLELVATTSDWISPLKTNLFTSDFNLCEKIDGVEFINNPKIVFDDQNKLRIPYVIVRKDFSKEFIKRELKFSAEIIIERQGNSLKLDFASTHSSKETEAINRRLMNRISKVLKDAGTTKSEKPNRITFDSFSNLERVRFFKRMTGGYLTILKKGDVHDMEISRDQSCPEFPNDPKVSWLNQTVRRLKIDGVKLNDVFLISDEKYYPFYHIQQMNVTYPYSIATNEGKCKIGFSFSSPSKSESSKDDYELTFAIHQITHDHQVNSDAKKEIFTKIRRATRDMVEAEFSKIITERTASSKAATA